MTGLDATRFTDSTFEPIALAIRSGFDESLHFGAGVVLDEHGEVEYSIGDPGLVVYPRSSLKPMQADAMIAQGVELAAESLAVACASHSGEEQHLDAVRRTLASSDVSIDALANTPTRPSGEAAREAAFRAGIEPSSLQQNCSGKHAAMLATCERNGWALDGYLDIDHPLQQAVLAHIGALAGERVSHVGIDGCGAPTHAISLRGLARAFATLARGSLVADAMRAHPNLVGGTGRDVTTWMSAVPGLIAKEGAAGVMAAALPNGRAVAYKISDGCDDARKAVVPKALRLLGVGGDVIQRVVPTVRVDVLGHGEPVGRLRPLDWPKRGSADED